MKRLFTIIAILLVACLIPLGLVGCESNKTASQIADVYSKLQESKSEFFDQTTRAFKVEFSATNIKSSMNVPSSKIYSLGKVYLPMLNTSMAFVNSKAKTFKDCLEKFGQDELNAVYNGLKDFEEALSNFSTSKKSFESVNSATGTGYSSFIGYIQSLIDAAQRFNIAFYNAYYKNIYMASTEFKNADGIKTEAMGCKLYVAYVLNNHYTKHYVWSSSNNINDFLSKSSYMTGCIDILNNANVSPYNQTDDATLIVLRENHESFLIDLNRTVKNMNSIPYKEIYQGTKRLEDLDQKIKDANNQVENFMEARYLPIYNAAVSLSA